MSNAVEINLLSTDNLKKIRNICDEEIDDMLEEFDILIEQPPSEEVIQLQIMFFDLIIKACKQESIESLNLKRNSMISSILKQAKEYLEDEDNLEDRELEPYNDEKLPEILNQMSVLDLFIQYSIDFTRPLFARILYTTLHQIDSELLKQFYETISVSIDAMLTRFRIFQKLEKQDSPSCYFQNIPSQTSCSICQCSFHQSTKINVFSSCGHILHHKCLKKQLRNSLLEYKKEGSTNVEISFQCSQCRQAFNNTKIFVEAAINFWKQQHELDTLEHRKCTRFSKPA